MRSSPAFARIFRVRSLLFFSFSFFGQRSRRLVNYTELRTVKQLAKEAPFVTESKIRWWIFHAERNGFDAAMIRIGTRVYIDKVAFNEWLEGQRVAASDRKAG